MARMTRNKAAEILGVSRQTISNYIKEGILGSYVGDLLRKFHGKSDLYKIRNLGKKTILIILDFIEENNLDFKEDGESDEDFYTRLNNKLSNKKD